MKLTLAVILASALSVSAQPLPLNANAWNLTGWKIDRFFNLVGSSNVHLANSSGAITFAFPVDTGKPTISTVNYLVTNYTAPIFPSSTSTLSLTLKVTTTGSPVFDYKTESFNTCIVPAHVRLYFERSNAGELGRWWSAPIAYELVDGMVMLTVPITTAQFGPDGVTPLPANWSSLYGKSRTESAATLAGFADALANIVQMGMTFGGGCFYGHGNYVTGGTAQFTVLNYSVQ